MGSEAKTSLDRMKLSAERTMRSPTVADRTRRTFGFAENKYVVQTFRSCRSHPSFRDGIGSGRSQRRANLPYSEVPRATIEAHAIAAIAAVNQESWWPSVPGAPFHDLLSRPLRCRMARHFDVEDFSLSVPNHEEDMKRLEQDCLDTEKVASPNVRCVAL
jgi:hypothetical protein